MVIIEVAEVADSKVAVVAVAEGDRSHEGLVDGCAAVRQAIVAKGRMLVVLISKVWSV